MSTFSKQTVAAALSGTEVVPVSQLSSTVTKTATTISALASDNSYNDSGAGFVTAGFAVGDYVNVSGFTGNAANNIYSAKITALTTSKMTIGGTDGNVIVDDAAGESVTISKWLSRRTTASALAAAGADVAAQTHATTSKTTPVDADEIPLADSAASYALKKLTWANLKATLKTYTDTLYAAIGAITGSGLTMATGKLLGRSTASTGAIEEITVGTGLSLSAGTLTATGTGVTDGDKGDITVSGSGATWTIDNDAVTYAKMQNVSATSRALGRKTAGAGDPEELTLSELLDFVGSAAQGDILYRGSSPWARLGAGIAGQVLQTGGPGANPSWASSSSGASTTQTGEFISGFIATPSNKDYKIVVKAAHGGTITETTTISASGTCTATFKINTTALGGTANSVSSSEQSQSQASSNVFSSGDDIVITISSNSSCADMSFTIKYTRTLS